jgi:DNA-binding NarL/FixJ family response regulator
VAQGVLPAATAEGLRQAVMYDLLATAKADYGMSHGVALVGGKLCWHDVQTYGDEARVGYLREMSGRPISDYGDISLSTLTPINRFSEVTDEEFRSNRLYRNNWLPMRRISVVAMSAVVGGTLVRWIGAYRVEGQGYFGAAVLHRLRRRTDAYVRALDIAHRLEARAAETRGLLLFSAEGEVTFGCASGRRWRSDRRLLDRIREAVRSEGRITSFSAGKAIVHITRIDDDGGDRAFCVEIVPATEWTLPELAVFSLQKRRVAELAALGATASEIARSLELSTSTVRTHLKQIYEKLGISSRTELVERVRLVAPEPPA